MSEGITKDEAYAIAELIDFNLIEIVRNDTDIDSIRWLKSVIHGYEKMCEIGGYTGVTEE